MSDDEHEESEAMSEQENDKVDSGDTLHEQKAADPLESVGIKEFDEEPANCSDDPEMSDEVLKLDVILDVPVTLSMEIGRTQVNIRNLLQLNQGSVIELDRFAGEPMDVFVNGTLIAHGEVVVVNDKFGIRLTDVISPSERVKRLG